METEDLDKILSKTYSELNAAEREAIREICGSEEEFLQLQQFFASVESYAQETQEDFPAAETKEKLDDLFHHTYQKKGILWYNSAWTALYPAEKRFGQRPLVRIAAILVVLISIIPFLDRPQSDTKTALAKMEKVEKKERSKDTAVAEEIGAGVELNVETEVPAASKEKTEAGFILMDESVSIPEVFTVQSAPPALSMTSAAFTIGSPSATYNWAHSDGIYMDSFSYNADDFTVSGNMAVLDLLTPTF